MRVESGELRVEQLAKLLKNAFALHYFKDKFHEAIAAELVANGVRLEEKQATSNASEQFASDNHVGGKWIPVTERLPERNKDGTLNAVLVTDGVIQHMAYFAKDEFYFTENGEMKEPMFYNVTHWMPLPEPPKGE